MPLVRRSNYPPNAGASFVVQCLAPETAPAAMSEAHAMTTQIRPIFDGKHLLDIPILARAATAFRQNYEKLSAELARLANAGDCTAIPGGWARGDRDSLFYHGRSDLGRFGECLVGRTRSNAIKVS